MLVLKTSGRISVTQQYCHTIHTFLSVLTSFTGNKQLLLNFFVVVVVVVSLLKQLTHRYLPVRFLLGLDPL